MEKCNISRPGCLPMLRLPRKVTRAKKDMDGWCCLVVLFGGGGGGCCALRFAFLDSVTRKFLIQTNLLMCINIYIYILR